jgi:pimeloyl-ACP methyl ester carboxylesterase
MNRERTATTPKFDGISRNRLRILTWAEIPSTIYAILRLPFGVGRLYAARRGDGTPILVIPGFAMSDHSTAILRAYLTWLGYNVSGWGFGQNLGAKTIGIYNERLMARLAELHDRVSRPVTLIGWSMGGIMARMIARAAPEKVRQIISLGAPFTGDPFANTVWQTYERMSGHSLAHPVARAKIAESKLPPPVPNLSLFSKSDGIVAWQSCIEPERSHTDNIEVQSAHCAFGFCPVILRTIADNLATGAAMSDKYAR